MADQSRFLSYPVGKMVLDRNPENYFAEVEQVAFGTGVLVDGLDFSDDKLLQGRTFSYSDTQRHRVGTELLAAAGQCTARRMSRRISGTDKCRMVRRSDGQNPHVNYEPSSLGGLQEAAPRGKDHEPHYDAS